MSNLTSIKKICCHFTRNIAFHQAGIRKSNNAFKIYFWIIANGNFAEIAILEFCKLFGSKNDKMMWANIVTNKEDFKKNIEVETELKFSEFEEYVKEVKKYRDKYLSHFDEEVKLPSLEIAKKCVFLYYNYVISLEGEGGFPSNLKDFYINCVKEAEENYPKIS